MGEFAIRKSDNVRIKIGTCEDMYYLRFEDRDKVKPEHNSVDPVKDAGELRFRLPFPDEDNVLPGEYTDHLRGVRLYKSGKYGADDFEDPSKADDPGIIQLRHEASGLLVNMPCYHGVKLPEVGNGIKVFWNGKGHSFELIQLRGVQTDTGLVVRPVVRCRHCRQQWRYDWSDILDFVQDKALRERLEVYMVLSALLHDLEA